MPTPIAIQPLPNQTLSVTLNGSSFDISIVETNGVMCASIANNQETLIQNSRITASTFLLPYLYEEENGNFLILNMNEQLIYYTNFGATQNLQWFSPADLAYLRGTNGP